MKPSVPLMFFGMLAGVVAAAANSVTEAELSARLPNCAARCFETYLPIAGCAQDDFGCLCADAKFMAATAACNAGNCTVVENLSATNQTNHACGVPARSQTATMVGVCTSFGLLAILMVAARLLHRGLSSQARLGWDDLWIGLAGIASLFQNVPVIPAGVLGFGRDMWSIPPDNITLSLKWLYVTYMMYQIAEALCQISILSFYLRIFTSPRQRKTVWILIGLVIGFGTGNTFAMIFQATPIKFMWDGWRGEFEGTYIDIRLFGFIRGGIEIALDLFILGLPLPMLSRLQMSASKKARVMSMFGVGFVITVVSCLRLWGLTQFAQTANPTYDNVSGVYWCVTECNLFIVVACMPAMHAILQRALPTIFTSFRSKSSSSYPSNHPHSHLKNTKGSYFENSGKSGGGKRSGSLPFGMISKSTEVDVYSTERSASDVELVTVDRLPGVGEGDSERGSERDGKSVRKLST